MRETESGLELVLPKPFSVSSWVSDLREVKWQVDSRGKGRAFRLTLLEVNGNGEEMERMRRFRAYVVTFICVVFGLPVCDLH